MKDALHLKDLDPSALDYSVFGHGDLVNIVLQRSGVMHDIRDSGQLIRAWEGGDHGPLDDVVRDMGVILAQRAVRMIQTEFVALLPVLDRVAPKRVADIGCGYGFFDLFLNHRYGSELLLIDIESNDRRHFGFEDEAAGYTSLKTARRFLMANGVPAASISTWNPEKNDLDGPSRIDLAVSFLSCGFHFPVDMYLPFFRFGVARNGAIILDLRGKFFQTSRRALKSLGKVEVLSEGKGKKRVLVTKRGPE